MADSTQEISMNPLLQRLAALRRRFWLVVGFRGTAWIIAILCGTAILAGVLDWRVHLPALVRAFLLAAGLGGAGWVAWRSMIQPLRANFDNFNLALRVESHFPVLNDALASAIQFLEQPESAARADSPALRQEVVRRAENRIKYLDFRPVVPTRGLRESAGALVLSVGIAIALTMANGSMARLALFRLTDPFGDHDWPRRSHIDVASKSLVGRNEPFEIQAQVQGLIPERAVVSFRFDGAPPLEQLYEISVEDGHGAFVARLDSSRVQQNFRFQVRANDALTTWKEVEVFPPPQLVAFAGRPSPQIHLSFPAYTELPASDLPDGGNSIEALAGTMVTVRAAVDRPLKHAWLEYPPELLPMLEDAAFVSAWGGRGLAGFAALAAVNSEGRSRIAAEIGEDQKSFSITLPARLSGTFTLRFEDALGLANSKLIEWHTQPDPAPNVQLERPAPGLDGLDVLPDAEIGLQIRADDPVLAIRGLWLDYRIKRFSGSAAGELESERMHLYDHAKVAHAAHQLLASALPGALPTVGPMPRLRLPRVEMRRRWSLTDLHLAPGDVLTIQAAADDFDDVVVNKQPGRSHEIDLHIISRTALDIALNEAQANIEQELVRIQKQQQEALAKVIPAETHWRNNSGRLQDKHLDDLMQAEQLQQQIRSRVGDKQEGLRGETARILQTLRDNHLPRSGIEERMGAVKAELDRLSGQELQQIEPQLTEARKQAESGNQTQKKNAAPRSPLTEARKHQEEVKKTLDELLKLLEPWSSTHEVKGEAKSILQEQERLAEQTARAAKEIPAGMEADQLKPEKRAELEQAAELQNKLAARTAQLLDKLDRLGERKKTQDPEAAQALKDAAKRGAENNAAGKMQEAEQSIRGNQLGRAEQQQRAGAQAMQDVVKALEERREQELDRLIKKMRDTEDKLARLTERQEELRKKTQAAAGLADAQKREQELRRLAREQAQLSQEAQEMLRQLSRLRSDRAGQAMSQASGRMQRVGARMEGGEDAEEQQKDALDRLNEAQRELEQARADAEDELARERDAKLTDTIKALRVRQEAHMAETARIHRQVLEHKAWTRELSGSWSDLADAERGLGEETQRLLDNNLKSAKVLSHLLKSSSAAMTQAAEKMTERFEQARQRRQNEVVGQDALDQVAEEAGEANVERSQKTALKRIDQLLDALKPESSAGGGAGGAGGGQGGQGGEQNQRQPPDENEPKLPAVAELKALKALQVELAERTREFDHQHPNSAKLEERALTELRNLRQELQEIRDLYHAITDPNAEAGEKP